MAEYENEDAAAVPEDDEFQFLLSLKSSIKENSKFFDRLVELVPAKFYLPSEGTAFHGYHGMSKGEKAAARKASKENIKNARRARFDPNNCLSTLELVKKNAEKQEQEKIVDDEMAINPSNEAENKEGASSATYEQLKKKLHRRIEELQARRGVAADSPHTPRNETNKERHKKKRKQDALREPAPSFVPVADKEVPSKKRAKVNADSTSKDSNEENPSSFEFGRVKIGVGNENIKDTRKKRKESKGHLLEKAMKLQTMLQDPEKGEGVATEHSWNVAASRAAGAKVLDDPKLLKQSMKREKQQHKKHSKKWKERVEQQKNAAETKQQVRKDHIAQRNKQKRDRLIAKREKKLLRPGFEGRKDGFINSRDCAMEYGRNENMLESHS